ncbi:MAG: hypothetical protein ACQGVC_15150 [Myxococcota bacterium]
MAEPKPAETASQETPKLSAVPEGQTPPAAPAAAPQAQEKEQEKGTRWGLWLLVALLVGVGAAAWIQTERLTTAEGRITALEDQVVASQAQLSAANLQIQTFEMERAQVREAVSDLSERVLLLNELVGGPSPVAPPPEAAPEAAPAE